MTITFTPGKRENVGLLIALAGASGSGKTYSAMQLAQGMVGPEGRFAVIDTEARRALHYADQFNFDHAELRAPFRPQTYIDAIDAAEAAGYPVILLDSMSHEYEGDGGILEWAAEIEAGTPKPGIESPRTYGGDWYKDWLEKPVTSPGNWKEPKSEHKRMMTRLLQSRAHLIFCLRADEKIEIQRVVDERTGRKKTVIIQAKDKPLRDRWSPICEKRFMFEMLTSVVLTPDHPGRPIPIKVQEQHLGYFPTDRPISQETGRQLAEWARGGAAAGQERQEPVAAGQYTLRGETYATPQEWADAVKLLVKTKAVAAKFNADRRADLAALCEDPQTSDIGWDLVDYLGKLP